MTTFEQEHFLCAPDLQVPPWNFQDPCGFNNLGVTVSVFCHICKLSTHIQRYHSFIHSFIYFQQFIDLLED